MKPVTRRFLAFHFVAALFFVRIAGAETAAIDHVILGIADLEQGIRQFETLAGVKPEFGGKHPGVGTHNALVALGEETYLEIIAPQPGASPEGRWSGLKDLKRLSPAGWAAHTTDLAQLLTALHQAGFQTGAPRAGSRARPDGKTLQWRSVDITEPQLPLAPFFIEWSKTSAHPSTTAPPGCRLESVTVHNPDSALLSRMFNAITLEAKVADSPTPSMSIILNCTKGRITFGER